MRPQLALGVIFVLLLSATAHSAEPTTQPLRYRLTPGQHLVFQSTTTATNSSFTTLTEGREYWVLKDNPDGGWRVLQGVSEERVYTPKPGGPISSSGSAAMSFDLLPDGTIRNVAGDDYFS